MKLLRHDGLGMSLYAKRLEAGTFIWPAGGSGEAVQVLAAQLGHLLDRTAGLLDQLELQLKELVAEDAAGADQTAETTTKVAGFEGCKPVKKPCPEPLLRERVVVETPSCRSACGSHRIVKMDEGITRTMEVVPRQWKAIETVRGTFTCRDAERTSQPPFAIALEPMAQEGPAFHPIRRGWAGPSLLAMVAGTVQEKGLERVAVDTTVMEKNTAHPIDARLHAPARGKLVGLVREAGVPLRQRSAIGRHVFQTNGEGTARVAAGRAGGALCPRPAIPAHAQGVALLQGVCRPGPARHPDLARQHPRRLLFQRPEDTGNLHSLHVPEVDCISKRKARQRDAFGTNVRVAATLDGGFILGARSMPGSPYADHTLVETLEKVEILTGPAAPHRNEILRTARRLGRTIWRRWSGYHRRSRAETRMHCVWLFGQRRFARAVDRQVARFHIRVAPNFDSLGPGFASGFVASMGWAGAKRCLRQALSSQALP